MQVLSVSYDSSLLNTRERILRNLGVHVTSVPSLAAAIVQCEQTRFDLLLLGHTVPTKDKIALVTKFQQYCPALIVEMYTADSPATGLTPNVFNSSQSPEELAELVRRILRLDLTSPLGEKAGAKGAGRK